MNKFEKISAEEPTRLNEEGARKEANMLRASMGVSIDTGEIIENVEKVNKWLTLIDAREATAKDYEVALSELEVLKFLAEKDPELLVKLSQYARASLLGAAMPFIIFGDVINETLKLNLGAKLPSNDAVDLIKKMKDGIFSDARSRLERLQKEGEKFGQDQNETEKKKVEV